MEPAGSASNATAKGRETAEMILTAAERVLISVGYARFTARKVAEAANIALGNLTWHFPKMDDLTRALIASVLSRYLRRWEAFRDGLSASTTPVPLGEVMNWLICDALESNTTKLFRELWAMGSQSPFAAAAMDDFYRQTVRAASDVARLMFPTLSESDALNLAYLMATISEGSIVVFGTNPDASRRVPILQQLATRALESVASKPDTLTHESDIALKKSRGISEVDSKTPLRKKAP